MKIRRFEHEAALGRAAAQHVAHEIRGAIAERRTARILAAAGGSQGALFQALTAQPDVAWNEVELFQLCEFVGVPAEHPASVRTALFERFIHPLRIGRYHLLDGEYDPKRTCRDEGQQLAAATVDLAIVGLGENGRLAFNSPPADFATEKPYLIVRVDESFRAHGVGGGRAFKSPVVAPARAIAISIRQLLKAKTIICFAPESRKADAVKRCVEGPVSPLAPASILRTHRDATLYVDTQSAALLNQQPLVEMP